VGLRLEGSFRPGRAAASVLVVLVPLTVRPAPVASQAAEWPVRSVDMDIDLTSGDGAAQVVLRYELNPVDDEHHEPTGPLQLEVLGFGEAAVDRLATQSGDSVELWPAQGARRAAAVMPPASPTASGIQMLELSYRVTAAVEVEGDRVRVRVPVVTGPPLVPGTSGDFSARLRLPSEWIVVEGFPAGFRRDDDGWWSVRLQVTPSMVGLRGRIGGGWRPSVPFAVDLLTVLVLLGFSVVGWRHLSAVARRTAA